MSKTLNKFKHILLAGCFFMLAGLTGCSSDSTPAAAATTTATYALPQPSVNCGGSSCVE